jgi:hypothetical protein
MQGVHIIQNYGNQSGIHHSTSQVVWNRTHFDASSSGLQGLEGGREIVKAIQRKRSVKHLVLGRNALGDDGVEYIMRYLCSEDGRKLPIEEISLDVTGMGDRALDSISEYLFNNQTIVGLHLPNVSHSSVCDTKSKTLLESS